MSLDTATLAVRELTLPSDLRAVCSIFRSTLALGKPLAAAPPAMGAYEALCLEWYLTRARDDVRLLVAGRDVVGYALVCTDEEAHERWVRKRALLVGVRAVPAAVASGFWRKRLRDVVELRHAPHPADAHAHMNILPAARTGLGALALCMAIDDVCRAAGHDAWYGEINARAGRRAAALERVLGEVVHRAPNHTLSWLVGKPVERLTVLRYLPDALAA